MKINELLNLVANTIEQINYEAIEKIHDPNTSDKTKAVLLEYLTRLRRLVKTYKD